MIDNSQEITGRKPVGGIENVGASPANQLLAGFDVESAAMILRAESANGEKRSLKASILPVKAKVPLHLMVGVGAQIDAAGNLEVGAWFEERFFSEENLADDMTRVVGCRLRVEGGSGFHKAALAEVLCEEQ